ncbi:ATP-dependent RNA helicase vasa-like [Artemia franciscana]|uniref:ATP-dependent RNA helicase vasa-like n=1 Tax=Artemia franciscana TaxID=6661 RepID=UPI0032DA1D91
MHETWRDPERGRVTYIPEEEEETYELVFHCGTPGGINLSTFSNVAAKVTGEDLHSGIDSFDPARWRSIILANIKKSGYTQPTPVQKWVIPVIMKKGDLMACEETGSGKTPNS